MISVLLQAIENDADREFMTEVFERHAGLIYSRISKVVSDPWAIEDILQNTVEKLIDRIPLLRGMDAIHRAAYISVAARNAAYNYLRDDRKEISWEDLPDSESALASAGSEIEDFLFLRERIELFEQVWQNLDERSRYLLESKYILERSSEEIASDLGIKPSSVRMYLTRARKTALDLMLKLQE